jgi:hypothetical protein
MNQRQPRRHDPGYLRWLSKRPCCVCGTAPPSDACHIRFASLAYGKREVGMGEKPDDRWSLPMCRACHVKQHGMNEKDFWRERHILPLLLAQKFYSEYGGSGGVVRHKVKPRVKGLGIKRKIVSRPFPKAKRKLKSRGFK